MDARRTVPSLLASLALVGCGGICGAMLGSLYVKLFVPKTGMGWDQLADALGGLMLGGLIGLVGGGVLAALLTPRRRAIAAAALFGVALLVVTGLWATRPEPKVQTPVVREEPFRPWYVVKIRIGHTEEILQAVAESARPIPFTETEIRSGGPTLTHIGWGPDFERCRVELTGEDLQELLPFVSAAADEAVDEICRTPREDDLGITLNIKLDGENRRGTVQGDCLADRPAMVALATAIDEVAVRRCSGTIPSAG